MIIRILAIEIVPTTSTEESISEVTTESAVVPSTCITETVATVFEPVKSAEELSQIAKLDSEKRAARALKFGIVPAVEPVEDAKAARAKRFGAEVPSVEVSFV